MSGYQHSQRTHFRPGPIVTVLLKNGKEEITEIKIYIITFYSIYRMLRMESWMSHLVAMSHSPLQIWS